MNSTVASKPSALDHVERRGDDDVGVVGASTRSSFLPNDDPVLDAHVSTHRHGSRMPANRSRSPSSSGIGPTNERARIQSSHG